MARPARAGARLRTEANLSKGERKVDAALRKAFNSLTAYTRHALLQSGLNPDTLDVNNKPWRDALTADVTPALMKVFKTSWDAIAAGTPDLDPGPYAVRHVESVWNRLVGASDDVFDAVRVELAAGRVGGESIPALSKRIDAVLGDSNRWKGRATTIARTETIGANNAGARAAAQQTGLVLGVAPEAVARTWMCLTPDNRVSARSVLAAARRPYDGLTVRVSTASGCAVTLTPKHPVLTGRGWKAAEDVDVTDHLFKVTGRQTSGAPDVDASPPMIGEVVDPRIEAGPVEVWPVGVGVDLDGDTPDGEVHVVRTDGGLLVDVEAAFPQGLGEFGLTPADVLGSARGLGRGPLDQRVWSHNAAPEGSAQCASLAFLDLWGLSAGPQDTSLRLTPDGDVGEPQHPADSVVGTAVLDRETPEGITGLVTADDVVAVEVGAWSGHVYDLSTAEGWFLSDSLLIHNSTMDERTRPDHADADGQTIFGMDATYQVGDAELAYPGDPDGPPEAVINCRCSETFSYPGDPDYPAEGLAASASTQRQEHPMTRPLTSRRALTAAGNDPTGVVVVALPAASDPCNSIGTEADKHASILYLGDLPTSSGDTPNAGLTDDFKATLLAAVEAAATASSGFTSTVDSVGSLGNDGARVWMLSGSDLSGLRDDLLADPDVAAAVDGVTQFPTYTPHVTIGYPDDAPDDAEAETDDDAPDAEDTAPDAPVDTSLLDPDTEAAAAEVTSITFDRLAVWWAGEQTEFTLGAAAPSVAAAGRLVDALARQLRVPRADLALALAAAAGDPAPVPSDEMAAGDPAPPLDEAVAEEAPGMEAGEDKFWGVCLTEDSQTGDGRVFAPGAVRWGDLPMPAGWIPQDGMGHDGAITMGRIDTLTRVGNLIAYTGTYDLDGAGYEVKRLVEGQFLTGVSVDTDDCDIEFLMPDGTPVDAFDLMFGDAAEDPILTVMDARVRSFVVCRVPAMEGSQAFIANGLPIGDGTVKPGAVEAAPAPAEAEPVVAAAYASLVAAGTVTDLDAWRPDPSVFANPMLEDNPTSLTVTADGRVYGYLAEWGVCHIGYDGVCVDPPPSLSDYAYFACGEVICSDGSKVRVGQLTMDTGHAGLGQHWQATVAHYDNTGTAVADIAIGDDAVGIWMAGRVRPSASPAKVEELRAAGKVSGDWREVVRGSGRLELVAGLVVNVPGFPVPKLGVSASAGRQTALVAAGIVPTPAERAIIAAGHRIPDTDSIRALVRDELAAERRRGLVASAGARIRARRVADATARIGRS